MRQQAVQAGHAHVVKPGNVAAQRLGRQRGLFTDGHIAGSAGCHADFPQKFLFHRRRNADLGDGVVIQLDFPSHQLRRLGRHAGDEDVARAAGNHRLGNAQNLLGRLAPPVDDFGRALAQGAVVVDFGIPKVFKRRQPEAAQRFFRGDFPALDLPQQGKQLFSLHLLSFIPD